MLGTIERSHPAVVLRPDTEIEHFVVNLSTGVNQLPDMAPVHADEVHRARSAKSMQEAKSGGQKSDELFLAHFACRHGKLAMMERSLAAHIAVDLHVVRRVGENDVGSAVR